MVLIQELLVLSSDAIADELFGSFIVYLEYTQRILSEYQVKFQFKTINTGYIQIIPHKVITMKYMMVTKKDEKEIKNLYNLYKHYNDKVIMQLEYIPIGIDDAEFSFVIDTELREVSFHDSSICVCNDEDKPVFFDLLYIMENDDRKIYEHFLFENYNNNMKEALFNDMQDELMVEKAIDQCKIFYGMINPTFFLTMLNEDECIQILLEQGFVGINLEVFNIQVTILNN